MKWDYIVIGAGSAGCALAYQLVKSAPDKTVLILEAGGSDRSLFIKFPAGVSQAARAHDWGYQAQPDPSRNGIAEQWLRGKVLGGSSSINGTKYVRPPAADFDRWSAQCDHAGRWSSSDVMPVFRELESSDQQSELRGKSGPLHVRTVRRPHPITKAFVTAATQAGYAFNTDYNAAEQEGVAYAQLSQRRGFRCSAADAFLKPILHRKNVRLLLNAFVERIELENGRAAAVAFRHDGKHRREVAGDIILCAGAINSPKLLMLSGIGDPEELEKHGIERHIELPAVGRNFKDQPLLRLTYRARIPTYNLTEGWLQKISFAAQFALHGEGPIANIFEGVAFLRSAATETLPDIRLAFLAVGAAILPDGSFSFAPYPAVAVSVIKSYPESTGRIRLASNNPEDPPLIECALLEQRADVDTLMRGVHTIRRIMNTQPIAALIEEETTPGRAIQDAAELEAFIRKSTGISYHSIGTCRMGTGANSVVDPDLRVRGTENLWIADASIMPDHVSADTNATCMMIGAKLGKQLAQAHRK